MFYSMLFSALPLLLAGIPGPLGNRLRATGLPVAVWQDGLQSHGSTPQAGIVVFDSRTGAGQKESLLAQSRGMKTIDVASLESKDSGGRIADGSLFSGPPTQDRRLARARFFDRFKRRVEQIGGFWMRLADFPFPYQAVLCEGSCPPELADIVAAFARIPVTAPLPVSASSDRDHSTVNWRPVQRPAADGIEGWIRRRTLAGLPLWAGPDQSTTSTDLGGSLANNFPLLWRTTFDEFARWWTTRATISFQAEKHKQEYRIRSVGDAGGFQPMLELWRGNHVASFALGVGQTIIREDGVVFAQDHQRHPAGFAALWTEVRQDIDAGGRDVPQSA